MVLKFSNIDAKMSTNYPLMNLKKTILDYYLKTYNLLNKPTIPTFLYDFHGSCNFGKEHLFRLSSLDKNIRLSSDRAGSQSIITDAMQWFYPTKTCLMGVIVYK